MEGIATMALEDLRHSEPLFRTLIEHSTDAVTLLTQDSTVIYANPSTERVTGYRPEEFVGTKTCNLVCAEDWKHVEWNNLLTRPGDSTAFMLRIRHKNGSWHWIEGTFTNLLNEPTVGALMGNYRDITERKEAEEHLHQSEERYRVLVEQATDGIFLTDCEGNFVDVNTAFCLLAGYTHKELLTRNIGDLTRTEDRERLFLGRNALLSGETLRSQWYIKRKNGSLVHTEFASKQLSNGYLQGLVHDIAERKEAERRKQEFLGMVSHELRSPLTAILGFIELAQFYLHQLPRNSPSEKDAVLSQIETMLVHMNQQVNIECRLVEALLDVARMEMHKFELSLQKHNLAQIVREMVAYQQQITHNRRLELLIPAQEQVPVLIDEERIGQVLINYLTNALKYSPADKVIQIGLTVEGNSARVFVRDQGPGLTLDQQQSIWERFYQTEPAMSSEGGLGLGLYIAKIIVQQHRGQVGVESEPGHGSTFWFTLPLINGPEQN